MAHYIYIFILKFPYYHAILIGAHIENSKALKIPLSIKIYFQYIVVTKANKHTNILKNILAVSFIKYQQHTY